MTEVSQISEFGKIFIFLITGFLAVGFTLFAARLVAPHNPNPEKLSTYECGEETEGSAWLPFNTRFYVIALIFLLFDVEMVFIFPWATVFANKDLIAAEPRWGTFSLVEMFVFIGILILGLVYAWRKGDLEWIKAVPAKPQTGVKIPAGLYEALNRQQSQYQVKPFELNTPPPTVAEPVAAAETAVATPVKKPQFKPAFKKTAANEPGKNE